VLSSHIVSFRVRAFGPSLLKDWPFLDLVCPLPHFFFFFTSLLYKVFYETFCRKHCKETNNCHNLFFGYSPKSTRKKIKNNSKKIDNFEKVGWGGFQMYIKKSCWSFGWNYELNHTSLYLKLERKCRFKVKVNDFWTNVHKNLV
jgi:hypothetical protein